MSLIKLISVVALLVPSAQATGHGSLDVNKSTAYLLDLIKSSRKPGADATLDCTWRRLAKELAPQVLSARLYSNETARRLHDALELTVLCGDTFTMESHKARAPRPRAPATANVTVFVSPMGDDKAAGTIQAPLRTLHAALAAVRAKRGALSSASSVTTAAIILRGGTYHLGGIGPLTLRASDSSLVLRA